MSNKSEIQHSQESEYCFPYHYVSKMPSNGFAQHFVDTWGINYISTIEFILSQIADCAPRSIIDIGCGAGRLTREIRRCFADANTVGVDYSQRAINLARAMNQDMLGVEFEQVDLTKKKFAAKYDVAVLMEVFEHIPLDDAESFLLGVSRSIAPGGVLFLTVPHANKPVEYKHFQHFTVDSISSYLDPLFNIVEVIPFERMSFVRGILNRLLCNRLFVLNNQRLLKALYDLHQKYLFHCTTEHQCQRLFVKALVK